MIFSPLLGNTRLKENLSGSLSRGRISHFYLISGPAGSGKRTLARLLAAAILCQSHTGCGTCSHCRKVLAGSHPDFITVDDPEKKTVPVELIRKTMSELYIQPNEADRKIYLFPRAQDMGIPGQNALLKVLEEPPAYGVFILLTDNPEKLLPTVRSRCTQLALSPLPEDLLLSRLKAEFPQAEEGLLQGVIARSGGYLGQARELMSQGETPQAQSFAKAFLERDPVALLQVLVPMEKWKRDALIPELSLWRQLLENALTVRSGLQATMPMARQLGEKRTGPELLQAIRALEKAILYAQGNVSVAAVCGYLSWELR